MNETILLPGMWNNKIKRNKDHQSQEVGILFDYEINNCLDLVNRVITVVSSKPDSSLKYKNQV